MKKQCKQTKTLFESNLKEKQRSMEQMKSTTTAEFYNYIILQLYTAVA